MSDFDKIFKKELMPQLQKELKLKNKFVAPHLEKIVINSGVGRISREKKSLDSIIEGISLITGQKPVLTKARKAISAFKIREGLPIGIKVTLRNKRMYDFFEKLIKVVLPRMRDFDGLNLDSLDKHGNLTIGLKEVSAFPELSRQQKTEYIFGLEITLVTKTPTRDAALLLFKKLGLIFKNNK